MTTKKQPLTTKKQPLNQDAQNALGRGTTGADDDLDVCTLDQHFVAIGACSEGKAWVAERGLDALGTWHALLDAGRFDWAIWWVTKERGGKAIEPVVRKAVLRASRVYAANACETAGIKEHAALLRSLKNNSSFATISAYADAASSAAYAYHSVSYADYVAAYAANASAAYPANAAAAAAYAAAYASSSATYAAYSAASSASASAYSAASAAYAASAAASAYAGGMKRDEERKLQIIDMRELCACPWTEDGK